MQDLDQSLRLLFLEPSFSLIQSFPGARRSLPPDYENTRFDFLTCLYREITVALNFGDARSSVAHFPSEWLEHFSTAGDQIERALTQGSFDQDALKAARDLPALVSPLQKFHQKKSEFADILARNLQDLLRDQSAALERAIETRDIDVLVTYLPEFIDPKATSPAHDVGKVVSLDRHRLRNRLSPSALEALLNQETTSSLILKSSYLNDTRTKLNEEKEYARMASQTAASLQDLSVRLGVLFKDHPAPPANRGRRRAPHAPDEP